MVMWITGMMLLWRFMFFFGVFLKDVVTMNIYTLLNINVTDSPFVSHDDRMMTEVLFLDELFLFAYSVECIYSKHPSMCFPQESNPALHHGKLKNTEV